MSMRFYGRLTAECGNQCERGGYHDVLDCQSDADCIACQLIEQEDDETLAACANGMLPLSDKARTCLIDEATASHFIVKRPDGRFKVRRT